MIALAVVAALITLLLGYAAYRNVSANPSRGKKSRPAKAPISRRSWKQAMTDATKGFNISWIVVGLGIGGFLLCHWLLKHGFPTAYTAWWNSDVFVPMNVALLAIAVLMGQKHTALRVVRTALIVLVVLIGLQGLYDSINWSKSPAGTPVRTTARSVSPALLPAEVVLPIIAQCESGGQQFEDDGVTPLRNREGSSAFGKYQFLESHREIAMELGHDLDTEEGQDGYARHLYGVSGTQDWEADLRSRECWEPQIATLSGQRELIYTIIAPTEGWTSIQKFPHEVWPRVEIKAVREEGQFAIRRNRKIYKFTPDNSDAIPGIINQVELQALGESPEEIWIRLYR